MKEILSVVSPEGASVTQKRGGARRLDTLAGKTVCEAWNGGFKGDFMFPVYREMLKARYPGVKIIPYSEFPAATLSGSPAHQREVDAKILALLREKGCDALISGNGG